MPGDLTLHFDGDHTPVVVEADGNGNAPSYGDPVAIVGESRRGTHVSLPSAAGEAIGILERQNLSTDGTGRYVPEDSVTHGANEVLGDSVAITRKKVDYLPYDDTGGWDQTETDPTTTSPSAGNLAVVGANGTLIAFDSATHARPFGRVFTTINRAEGTAGKLGVLRY